ncbi:MAG: Pr6Pr family membrane protein [Candidatus Kariarchaeaceae archaeon]|jgi:hypothetical protein
MTSEVPTLAKILRIILIGTAGFSLGIRIILDTQAGRFPLYTFRYFTLQSNLLIWIWTVLAVVLQGKPSYGKLTGSLKTALTAYITVTWLVYMLILSDGTPPDGIDFWTNLFNHYANPIIFIADFFIAERTRLTYKWLLPSLSYPYAYLTFALIWGSLTDEYLYFFVDLPTLGVTGLIIWVALLSVAFLTFGLIYTVINRKFLTSEP